MQRMHAVSPAGLCHEAPLIHLSSPLLLRHDSGDAKVRVLFLLLPRINLTHSIATRARTNARARVPRHERAQ